MRTAKRTDRKTEPLPTLRTRISLDRVFSLHEMEMIKRGVVPKQMEDKWFVFWERGHLYFHRSWTGLCIYVVRFIKEKDVWRMTQAEVNRDPSQYSVTNDKRNAQLISYLISVLLLGEASQFPASLEGGHGKSQLEAWAFTGRASLGDHPNRER